MADSNDIQHSILEMQAKRSRLGIKKQTLQFEINKIKQMLLYIKEGETFQELIDKKRQLTTETHDLDAELSELKINLKKRQQLKEEVLKDERPNAQNISFNADIVVLRDKYLSFAGDKTRVASMRSMAAEFAEELTKLLKKNR